MTDYKITDINRLLTIPNGSYLETIKSAPCGLMESIYAKHYDTEITVSIADLMTDIGTHQNYDIKLNGVLILRIRDFELDYLNLEITEEEQK